MKEKCPRPLYVLGYLTLVLTLSAPDSLSVCKLSLNYPCKISCLVLRIKQLIIHSNLKNLLARKLWRLSVRKTQQYVILYGVSVAERVKDDDLSASTPLKAGKSARVHHKQKRA